MNKGRMEAFSDGVIAIIITIMVLELKAPHGSPMATHHIAYVLSRRTELVSLTHRKQDSVKQMTHSRRCETEKYCKANVDKEVPSAARFARGCGPEDINETGSRLWSGFHPWTTLRIYATSQANDDYRRRPPAQLV